MKFLKRLSSAWKAFCSASGDDSEATGENEEVISLRCDLATLKLDLEKAHLSLSSTKRQIDDIELRQRVIAVQEAESRLDEMFANLAAPLSQLRMQQTLMESGRNISSQSVMALARQFADAVESMGLLPIGRIGETIEYDPQRFHPLSSEVVMKPGDRAVVRIIGYEREGRIIRKAFVEKE
jgi:molecular chaperone GrpE (heat shock protein)